MVHRFRSALLGGELRRGIITLVGGTVLGRAVIVGSSPIITRLFVPTEVGEFATVLSIVAILIVVGDLSYSAAIVLPRSAASTAAAEAVVVSIVTRVSAYSARASVQGTGRRSRILRVPAGSPARTETATRLR